MISRFKTCHFGAYRGVDVMLEYCKGPAILGRDQELLQLVRPNHDQLLVLSLIASYRTV